MEIDNNCKKEMYFYEVLIFCKGLKQYNLYKKDGDDDDDDNDAHRDSTRIPVEQNPDLKENPDPNLKFQISAKWDPDQNVKSQLIPVGIPFMTGILVGSQLLFHLGR